MKKEISKINKTQPLSKKDIEYYVGEWYQNKESKEIYSIARTKSNCIELSKYNRYSNSRDSYISTYTITYEEMDSDFTKFEEAQVYFNNKIENSRQLLNEKTLLLTEAARVEVQNKSENQLPAVNVKDRSNQVVQT